MTKKSSNSLKKHTGVIAETKWLTVYMYETLSIYAKPRFWVWGPTLQMN